MLGLAALAACGASVLDAAGGQQVRLDDYVRLKIENLPGPHRDWIDEEVRWIITDAEREVFLRLDSEARRDRFIRAFWGQRDPSPGTEQNEYRDLHYERYQYVNQNFGRQQPRPGWDTDRGRIWILLGRPQSINRLPNTNLAVPVEIWFYSVDPALGVPPFFYLIFFRDRGVGGYRLWSPTMDGVRGLLNPAGKQSLARAAGPDSALGSLGLGATEEDRAVAMLRQVDLELATAAASLVPGESGFGGVSPLRSEIVLNRVLALPTRLMPRADWAYNVLTGVTESEVRFETLPMESAVVALLDPSGDPFLHTVTRTQGDRLNLNNYEDRYYVTFEFSSSVRDEELRFLQQAEPVTLQADLDEETARRLRGGPVQYMDRSPAVPGVYTVDVVLENNLTREYARAEHRVRVPAPDPDAVGSAYPFLIIESEDLGADLYDPFADHYPFQIGSRFLVPALGGPFLQDGTAALFWQLYVPAGRFEPLELVVSLLDAQQRVLLRKQIRVPTSERDAYGVINRLIELDLTGVPSGEYRLECDLVQDERPAFSLSLRVDPPGSYTRPFLHAPRKPPAAASQVRLARARQLRTIGQTEAAIEQIAEVLRREPNLAAALPLQIELLTDAGRHEEVGRLLAPLLIESPNDVALLLQMAAVRAELADHYDAIRFYERARLAGAETTPELLNALASEYYAEGRNDRVIELLRRSLELRPEQLQIRRLLEELESGEQLPT